MIIKGRSPTMRHVSRTRTPRFKSSMWTPNTNLQTYWQKGNFTRDEWNNLLHLFSSITHFSLFCCSQSFKRWRKGCQNRRERRGSWQSQSRRRWTWPSLSRQVLRLQNPIASKSPGILKAPCQNDWTSTGKPDTRKFNWDAASSSQWWQKKMQFWMQVRGDSSRQKKTRNTGISLKIQKVREDSSLQETQKLKAKAKFGHPISKNQQIAHRTWRRFSRL